MASLEEDHKLFQKIMKETVEHYSSSLGPDKFKTMELYRMFHDITFFEKMYASPEERREYLEMMNASYEDKKAWEADGCPLPDGLERLLREGPRKPETQQKESWEKDPDEWKLG